MGAVQRIRTGPVAFEYRSEIGEICVDERPPAHCPAAARHLGDCLSHFDPRTPALRRRRARAIPPGLAPTGHPHGSGRLAPCRCRCGGEECGLASCPLESDGGHVVRDRLTYECDDGPMLVRDPDADPAAGPFPPSGPLRSVFDRARYPTELERHFAR